jgi:two-component system cell cycle sensor histidine kinase/response regulator CckA
VVSRRAADCAGFDNRPGMIIYRYKFRNGREALGIAERSIGPIHVLVTDIVMPNMRGPELVKRLKVLRPNLKVIYMSGYLEYNSDRGQVLDQDFSLQKPFARETLVSKVVV